MKFSHVILVLGVFVSSGIARAGDCHVQQFHFVYGLETSAQSTVKSGVNCSVTLNARSGVNTMKITRPAEHGIVGMAGNYKWAYKSTPGYVGQDHYIVEVSGESTSGRQQTIMNGTATISMTVDVVP